MVVCKFGGSSLSSETQFKKVKNIVKNCNKRRVVIVSALGKREDSDNKLTDLFYVIYTHALHGICYEGLWEEVKTRFVDIKKDLSLTFEIEAELAHIKKNLDANLLTVDDLVSRGEYLTARLMSEYLNFEFIDAKDVITFCANGEIDMEQTKSKLQQKIQEKSKVVIPGFYGAYNTTGKIKLFGRGGSDITGAIIAACLGAEKYENFTDVSGVLMADPRIIDTPPAIPRLTYEELSELTYMGASVLHEASAHPVRDAGIPIHIKNTNDPDAQGTIICDGDNSENKPQITGISGKKDFLSFNIYKNHMSSEIGFLRKTLAIFERYQVNIEHIPTGIDHLGVVVLASGVAHCLEDLIEVLKSELEADEVLIKDGIALITIVGRGTTHDAVFLGRTFSALGKVGINISFIAQSPKKLNIILGVKNEDYIEATKTLYQELVMS